MSNSQSITVLASATRTASVDSPKCFSMSHDGVRLVVNVSALPNWNDDADDGTTPEIASDATITATVQGFEPISGKWYTLLAGSTMSTVTSAVLTVLPHITVSANVAASAVLPGIFRVSVVQGGTTGAPIVYSVTGELI